MLTTEVIFMCGETEFGWYLCTMNAIDIDFLGPFNWCHFGEMAFQLGQLVDRLASSAQLNVSATRQLVGFWMSFVKYRFSVSALAICILADAFCSTFRSLSFRLKNNEFVFEARKNWQVLEITRRFELVGTRTRRTLSQTALQKDHVWICLLLLKSHTSPCALLCTSGRIQWLAKQRKKRHSV